MTATVVMTSAALFKKKKQTLSAGEGGSKAGGDSGAVGGSGKGSFAAQRCRGQVLEKRTFFAKTLSFCLSFCYRFGLRFSYVFLYVEASMQCKKKRITRQAASGSSQTADCINRFCNM